MNKSIVSTRSGLLATAAAIAFGGTAWSQVTVFENGFEADVSGWDLLALPNQPTRVSSGTGGVVSSSGGFHSTITSAATRWGAYRAVFPAQGYTTSVDVYLDVDGGVPNDTRFDFTSAINNAAGSHRRDFVFNGGFYNDSDLTGTGNRFVFSGSNGSGRAGAFPKNPARSPVAISTTGWYTLEHVFSDNGSGVLQAVLNLKSGATVLGSWTLSDPSDVIGSTVGGNRYGWFSSNEFPSLAIDNSGIEMDVPPPVHNVTDNIYFETIAGALAAATTGAGDVIELAAGTYTEAALNISKSVTIQGPNAGVAGTAVRAAEARISNTALTVTAAGVVIDGLEIYQTNNSTSPVSIQASNVTVSNSVIKREGVDAGSTVRGIEISPGLSGYSIEGNLITGATDGGFFGGHKSWNSGIYVNGGSGTISGNTFENCRSVLNLDDFNAGISVTGNSFRNSGSYISFGGSTPTTGSYTISGNDFDFNLVAPALPSTFFNNSNVAPAFRIDATGNTFGGTATAALSDADKFAIEARMFHRGRSGRLGVVDYSAGEQVVVGTTIASAISAASGGDTVLVGPGTYAETLVLSKSLTLRGPNHLISPNTDVRGAEAVLTGSIAATPSVSSALVIEGLRFAGASPLTSNGNSPGTVHIDYTFRRNLLDSGSAQLALFVGTATNSASALIEDNRFLAMSGNAIQMVAGPGSFQAVISNNVIDGTGFAGINSDGLTNSTITGNSFSNTSQQGVQVAGPSGNVTVSGNTFTNANTSNGADRGAVRVYGTAFTGPVHVTGNVITGGNTAFAVRNGEAIAGKDILFTGNSMSGVGGDAVYHGGTGNLDATGNFWGDDDGPAGSPGTVTGAVLFNPWYGASNHALPLILSDLRTGILINTEISDVQGNVPDLYIAPGTTVTVTPTGGLNVTELELAEGATLFVNGGELVIGDGSKISGNFTIFNSFGSWDINGDTTFEIGQSLALITDIHVAAGKTLTVNGGGELVLDGCVIDSQTPGSPYFIEVEDDGLLTLVRSVVSDAQINIDTLSSSVPANFRSRVFDNSFTNSDIEATPDSRVFHNLFDGGTNGAANTDLSSAFDPVDGWSNVTTAAALQNKFTLEFAAPVDPTRTLDAGNLFVQPTDPVVVDMKVASLGSNTIIAAEALLGYNSNLLTLVSPTPAVSPESGWSVIVDDDSIDGALGLVDSAIGLDLLPPPGDDGISADSTIAKVNFTATAPGLTIGFFRAQTNGEFNPDGTFVKDTRLTKSALGIPSFLSSFTANSGELVIDNQDPTIATPAVSGTQVQPSVLTPVDVLSPANRVLRNGTPVILTFTAADSGLAGLDALDASDDLALTADNGTTVLDSTNYTVSASESMGVVTYTVTLNVPVTATTGTYAVEATVLDRSGNESAEALLGSFVIANEAIATVQLQSFEATTRDVTFVATNGGGSVLATWTKTITNFSGGIGSVALENVPAGTAAISAKTDWTLRSKVPASFSPEGVGAVSLTGADLLKGGDLTGDNVVNTLDYASLRFNWLTANAVADITGDGQVQSGDYLPLQANFYTVGDPQ